MSISISIDTSKINKDWLIAGKTGKKYLAIEVYENETPDNYGNTHAVKQAAPKDIKAKMKAAGERVPYIGNGKDWSKINRDDQQVPRKNQPTEAQMANQTGEGVDLDVPFN